MKRLIALFAVLCLVGVVHAGGPAGDVAKKAVLEPVTLTGKIVKVEQAEDADVVESYVLTTEEGDEVALVVAQTADGEDVVALADYVDQEVELVVLTKTDAETGKVVKAKVLEAKALEVAPAEDPVAEETLTPAN